MHILRPGQNVSDLLRDRAKLAGVKDVDLHLSVREARDRSRECIRTDARMARLRVYVSEPKCDLLRRGAIRQRDNQRGGDCRHSSELHHGALPSVFPPKRPSPDTFCYRLRITCPARAPVRMPSERVVTPLTTTCRIPHATWFGSNVVPRSPNSSAENTAMSARAPTRIEPRSASPRNFAG